MMYLSCFLIGFFVWLALGLTAFVMERQDARARLLKRLDIILPCECLHPALTFSGRG
jgi:hypothetical protein